MGISTKEKNEIFEILIAYPDCVDWNCIGRNEPSPQAYSDAASFMAKGSAEHEEMKNALLRAFPTAKEIRYYRQLKLLALMFDTDEKGVNALGFLRMYISIKEGMKEEE